MRRPPRRQRALRPSEDQLARRFAISRESAVVIWPDVRSEWWRHPMLQETAERSPLQRPYASPTPKPDDGLVNDWHVVAFSKDVAEGQMIAVRLLGEDLVVWRTGGKVMVWKDLCIHRGARLSKGWVVDGTV